jgi:hypothetical protein
MQEDNSSLSEKVADFSTANNDHDSEIWAERQNGDDTQSSEE